MGGAWRRMARDALSLPHADQERGAVAGCGPRATLARARSGLSRLVQTSDVVEAARGARVGKDAEVTVVGCRLEDRDAAASATRHSKMYLPEGRLRRAGAASLCG